MIAIVNYGLGNVQAIANIYRSKNIEVEAAADADTLRRADRIILPGVGAFDHAMQRLTDSGMREVLTQEVLGAKKPLLGICVGMQMLAERSDEGALPGLGWIKGEVRRFDTTRFAQRTHLPHMGWNSVVPRAGSGLMRDLDATSRFYFLHSYYFAPASEADVLATTDYNGQYASGVGHGQVLGVQFHPEKSHRWGIQLLLNFATL